MAVEWSVVAPVVATLLGSLPVSAVAVREGGYSLAGRWVVRDAGGRAAFVKAETEYGTEHGTHVEHLVYASVDSPHLPRLYGYEPGGGDVPRVLVTEDLSAARWGTPLSADDAGALSAAFDALSVVRAPSSLPPVAWPSRWDAFAEDPAPLVATGLVTAEWAAAHAGALAIAAAGADVAGDRLVHCDVWLQNWCRTPRGAVLVDWAGAGAANPLLMRAWGEAGVRAAGGPAGVVLSGRPEWAAWMAGQAAYFLSRSRDVPPRLLETERREGLATLRWACDELDLPYPPVGAAFAGLGPWRP